MVVPYAYTHIVLRFSKFLQCKASCAIQACGAQLFNSRFSVTTTDSQDFRHAYAYNSTATEHYRCIQRTAHTDTILAHDALHCKDMENRSMYHTRIRIWYHTRIPYAYTHMVPYAYTHMVPYAYTHMVPYAYTHMVPYAYTHMVPYAYTIRVYAYGTIRVYAYGTIRVWYKIRIIWYRT